VRAPGVRTDLARVIADASTGTVAVDLRERSHPMYEIRSPAANEVATRGADGTTAWTRDGVAVAKGLRIDIVDTGGAGDAFAAGSVGWLICGHPPCDALHLANALEAFVASSAGEIPAWDLPGILTFETERARR